MTLTILHYIDFHIQLFSFFKLLSCVRPITLPNYIFYLVHAMLIKLYLQIFRYITIPILLVPESDLPGVLKAEYHP